MSKDMIWAFFIMLSDHFDYDSQAPAAGMYLDPPYKEENRTDFEVWDDTIKFLSEHDYNTVLIDVGDGIRYESHPEISAPNAISKELMKKKLDDISALGMTPIPKLNFSACHHIWLKEYTRMVSTPEYFRVVTDLISEVCELFEGPSLFHLGLDEENYDCQHRSCEKVLIRGENLWWHDLYQYFDIVEKNGARPWVWSDYFWHHPKSFLTHMPKEVLQSNWHYKTFRDLPPVPENYEVPDSGYLSNSVAMRDRICQDAYEKLDRAGFDQIPTCSSYASRQNQYQTMMFCKEKVSKEHLKGYLTASWAQTWEDYRYKILYDAHKFYLGRQKAYPESF